MYDSPTEIIRRLGDYLMMPLSPDKGELTAQLTGLEALRFELSDNRTRIYRLLAEKKNQMLYPQEKGKTELDRRVMLSSSVAVIEKDHMFLDSLEGIVRDRLQLGQILLSIDNPS